MKRVPSKLIASAVLAAGVLGGVPCVAHAAIVSTYVGQNLDGSVMLYFEGVGVFTVSTGLQNGIAGTAAGDVVQAGPGQTNPIVLGSGVGVGPIAFANPRQFAGNPNIPEPQTFFGLDVVLNDGNHFGYVETDSGGGVIGYAFETAANTEIVTAPIVASGAVPEPASLALLAIGLTCAALVRRRNIPETSGRPERSIA